MALKNISLHSVPVRFELWSRSVPDATVPVSVSASPATAPAVASLPSSAPSGRTGCAVWCWCGASRGRPLLLRLHSSLMMMFFCARMILAPDLVCIVTRFGPILVTIPRSVWKTPGFRIRTLLPVTSSHFSSGGTVLLFFRALVFPKLARTRRVSSAACCSCSSCSCCIRSLMSSPLLINAFVEL
jgi:hypothetical protein